ncbi:MAG: hypothetical protein ABSC23_06030 [Bryobacteraceae bacterium]
MFTPDTDRELLGNLIAVGYGLGGAVLLFGLCRATANQSLLKRAAISVSPVVLLALSEYRYLCREIAAVFGTALLFAAIGRLRSQASTRWHYRVWVGVLFAACALLSTVSLLYVRRIGVGAILVVTIFVAASGWFKRVPGPCFETAVVVSPIVVLASLPLPVIGGQNFPSRYGWIFLFNNGQTDQALMAAGFSSLAVSLVFLCGWLLSRLVRAVTMRWVAVFSLGAGLIVFPPYDPRAYYHLLSAVLIGATAGRQRLLPSPGNEMVRISLTLASVLVLFVLDFLLLYRTLDARVEYVTASASVAAMGLIYGIAIGSWWDKARP